MSILNLHFSFPAPNGPPQSFTPSAGTQNVTFSWSPPAPTLRNGIITGYSLSCVPDGGGESSVSMHYTQTGTFTLEGFASATTYNCSISASNSEGSGPVANVMVATMMMVSTIIHFGTHSLMCNYSTTVDNKYHYMKMPVLIAYISIAILFQLQLRGLPACQEWVVSWDVQ